MTLAVCDRKVDLLDWQNLLEINRSISKLFLVPDLKVSNYEYIPSPTNAPFNHFLFLSVFFFDSVTAKCCEDVYNTIYKASSIILLKVRPISAQFISIPVFCWFIWAAVELTV